MLKIDTFTAKRPILKQNRAKSPKKCSNLFPALCQMLGWIKKKKS